MSTTIPNWVPKYIKQNVNYRAGTTPTSERFNELYNLLIIQGDFNTSTLETLIANLSGFDVEFQEVQHGNSQFQTDITAALNNAITSINAAYKLADTNLSTQLTQAVQLMLQDYVTTGNVTSLFEQNAANITAQVVAIIGPDMVNLATLQSQLELTSTNILAEVSTTLKNYSTTTEMSAAIDLRAGSITQTVQEQINGVTQDLSQVQQTADMINWLVKSGDSASNFTITDRLASLISPNIDLTGYVTFHALADPSEITTIDGGILRSMSGSLAGFTFSEDPITGGFQYRDDVNQRFMRMNPYSTWDGVGGYNYNYGSIDCGISDDGKNTLVHLRSDGYARFGLVSKNGDAIRFNDFLRLAQGVAGASDTILYSKNFRISTDGEIMIKSKDIPNGIAAMTIRSGSMTTVDVNGNSVTYGFVKDANGYITEISNGVNTVPIVWE